MKRHKENNFTPGDILNMASEKPKLMKEWKDHVVPEHHACPKCGENRKLKLVTLRSTFNNCETCGTNYITTEYLKRGRHGTKED